MLPCNPPPQEPPRGENETVFKRLMCEYVFMCLAPSFSCLGSVPGRARYAHPLINIPPVNTARLTCTVLSVVQRGVHRRNSITSRITVTGLHPAAPQVPGSSLEVQGSRTPHSTRKSRHWRSGGYNGSVIHGATCCCAEVPMPVRAPSHAPQKGTARGTPCVRRQPFAAAPPIKRTGTCPVRNAPWDE